MVSRILADIRLTVFKLERNVLYFLLRGTMQNELHPQTEPLFDVLGKHPCITSPSNIQDDSVMWAVPKKRRSLEKRLNRKFGWPNQVWKPLLPKKNLLTCKTCGGNLEAGCLCPNCYSKVKTETEEMHQVIERDIGLNPIDKEIVILYKEEREEFEYNFKGKRIVELLKKRPHWFSKNLLEKTSKGLSSSSNVKPSDLA